MTPAAVEAICFSARLALHGHRVTPCQLEILLRLRENAHPLLGITGRRRGVIVLNLHRLHRLGLVRHRRGSEISYELTPSGRVITGG